MRWDGNLEFGELFLLRTRHREIVFSQLNHRTSPFQDQQQSTHVDRMDIFDRQVERFITGYVHMASRQLDFRLIRFRFRF